MAYFKCYINKFLLILELFGLVSSPMAYYKVIMKGFMYLGNKNARVKGCSGILGDLRENN